MGFRAVPARPAAPSRSCVLHFAATCSAAEAKASEREFVAFIQPRMPGARALGVSRAVVSPLLRTKASAIAAITGTGGPRGTPAWAGCAPGLPRRRRLGGCSSARKRGLADGIGLRLCPAALRAGCAFFVPQGEDLERILTVWGADLVSNALAMGLDKVTGTVMPRMVFSKLSTYVKRVMERGTAAHGDESSSLAAGIATHESIVRRHLR